MRGDVKFFEVFGPGLRLLQHAGIFPQILEVFGRLLEEELDGFLIGPVHRLSSTNTAAARDSVGDRLAIDAAIADHQGFKFHGHVGERLRVAQKKITAGFERVVKAPENREAAFFVKST